jgi:hypothetical protein
VDKDLQNMADYYGQEVIDLMTPGEFYELYRQFAYGQKQKSGTEQEAEHS